MQQQTFDWMPLVVGCLLSGGLWVWLLWQRSYKLSLQTIFAITTGFAVLSLLGTPAGQTMIRRIKYANQWQDWITLGILLAAWLFTTSMLRRMARKQ